MTPPPELQQLAVNFLATFISSLRPQFSGWRLFLATFFIGQLTYRTTTLIHLHTPRKCLPYVTRGPRDLHEPPRPGGYGGPPTGSGNSGQTTLEGGEGVSGDETIAKKVVSFSREKRVTPSVAAPTLVTPLP